MFCEKCGNRMEGGAKFCTACGSPAPKLEGMAAQQPMPQTDETAAAQQTAPQTGETAAPQQQTTPQPEMQPGQEQPQWPGAQPQYGQYTEYPYTQPKRMSPKAKRAIIFSSIGAVILAAAVIIFLVISGSPVNRFKGFLQAEKYSEAADLYNEEISGHADMEEAAVKALSERIDSIKTQFTDEKISFEDAESALEDIAGMGVIEEDDVYDTYQDIVALNDSRNAFAKGEKLLGSKDYAGALAQYRNVIRDDKNYDKAQQQITAAENAYRSDVLGKADSLIAENKYDEALGLLNDALNVLQGDADITGKITDCSNAQTEHIRAQALEDAQNSVNAGDFTGAFSTLDDALAQLPGDADLQNALEGYENDFIERAKTDAAAAFGEAKDYEAALSVINGALLIMPDDGTLLEQQTYYEGFRPVWLNDLEASDTSGNIYDNRYTMDNKDNMYTNSFSVDGSYVGVFYAEFQIGGAYAKFEGVCAVPDVCSSDSDKYFEVYGDGNLLFTSSAMVMGSDPQPFSIDLTGVQVLKIQYPATPGINQMATIFDGRLSK